MNIADIKAALDCIVKGDVIKTDVCKLLMDYENEESIN